MDVYERETGKILLQALDTLLLCRISISYYTIHKKGWPILSSIPAVIKSKENYEEKEVIIPISF